MTDLKTALRAVVEALPGATKGPYATPLVDDTQLVGRGGVEIAAAVGDYESDFEADCMERNMAFLAASANLARHAPELLAMVEECERLRADTAAIRALKSNPQPAGGGGPTTPAQDTETNQ